MATPERHVSTVSMLLSPEPKVVVEYPNAGPCASAQACVVQKQQMQRKTICFIARPRPRKSQISRSAYNRANVFCSPQALIGSITSSDPFGSKNLRWILCHSRGRNHDIVVVVQVPFPNLMYEIHEVDRSYRARCCLPRFWLVA
jgi:hypothetical protein